MISFLSIFLSLITSLIAFLKLQNTSGMSQDGSGSFHQPS